MVDPLCSHPCRSRPDLVDSGPPARVRGFTLIEAVVVLAIIGLMVAFAIPSMARARIRAIMLGQMKQVRQAVMLTRIDAIRGGRQTVLGFTTVLGRQALVAWRDDNGDADQQAGEQTIGRWTFSERVTVADDPDIPLRVLTGSDKGVVFLANGTTLSGFGGGATGAGAFRLNDQNGNSFQVVIQGGSGSVREQMWDGSDWSDRFVNWRY